MRSPQLPVDGVVRATALIITFCAIGGFASGSPLLGVIRATALIPGGAFGQSTAMILAPFKAEKGIESLQRFEPHT